MIQVFIEVAAGSNEKNLYNEKTLELKGTRRVSQSYPYPYGFIIGTSSEDGDAIDCYLITKDKLEPGSIVECEPIALLEQHEGNEIDHKVLAVLHGQHVQVGKELLKELQDFIYAIFSQYPDIQIRVGPIHSGDAAMSHIQHYRNT